MQDQSGENQDCPTCGGQGYMWQIEAQLGGDYFREKPAACHSWKVSCPRCGGAGAIKKIIAVILAAMALFYWCFDDCATV